MRSVDDLVARGLVSLEEAARLQPVVDRYALFVSDYYLSLIDPDDPDCPIRKQALPDPAELSDLPSERADPIGDGAHRIGDVLVRRYPDRALLFPTLRCPMFCRYCFRKVALNERAPIRLRRELDGALDWLGRHPEVTEVILSGGDPLMLANAQLDGLLRRLDALGTLRRIRVHTRFPVTDPARIDTELAEVLDAHRPIHVVAHFNHPRELTELARIGVERLRRAGVSVWNQTVLLRGINDDTETLARLFLGLIDWQVVPYYLHHLDLTLGTHHFRTSIERGLEITRSLRGQLSGQALPTYVLDIPGGAGKVPVDSGYVRPVAPGRWRLVSPLDGAAHEYVDPAHGTGR